MQMDGEAAMICPRCQSLMMVDMFEDLLDDSGVLSFRAWRCIPCGEVIDPVILKNQLERPSPKIGRARLRRTSP